MNMFKTLMVVVGVCVPMLASAAQSQEYFGGSYTCDVKEINRANAHMVYLFASVSDYNHFYQDRAGKYAGCPGALSQQMTAALTRCLNQIKAHEQQQQRAGQNLPFNYVPGCRKDYSSLAEAAGSSGAATQAMSPSSSAVQCDKESVKATAYDHIRRYKGTGEWSKEVYKQKREEYQNSLRSCPDGDKLIDKYKDYRKKARKDY